jgi:Set1/Ash2 histone methyltransferase complex subunit ASH2
MQDVAGGKRANSTEVDLTRKKGKKTGRRTALTEDSVEAAAGDFVRVIPFSGVADDDVGATVRLSIKDKASGLDLSADRAAVTGWKGFRSVRATHGFHEGTHYCELTVEHLGETGHCRLGWSTKQAEINAPVGYDQHGFGYRDLEGSKVHKASRQEYGEPFGQGDVLGLFLHLPEGGRALESRPGSELGRYKGSLYQLMPQQTDPQPLQGSVVAFTRNGVLQGPAFKDVLEGTYYPTASLFTAHKQKDGAKVSFNFGPDFKYPPPTIDGCPAAAPMSDIPAKQAAAAEAEEAAALAGAAAAAGSVLAAAEAGAAAAAGQFEAAGAGPEDGVAAEVPAVVGAPAAAAAPSPPPQPPAAAAGGMA